MALRNQASVRVVAGRYRGRVLAYPPGKILRPTMSRARESVFNTLQGSIKDIVFFDLYCAAGSMGIEALSRGAPLVHFVEKDARALECLEENLARLAPGTEAAHVHRRDVLEFLLHDFATLAEAPFIVYADPPYDSGDAKKVLAHFDSNPYPELESLIIEHRAGMPGGQGASLQLEREKRFGDTTVSYYELQDD